jgi:hypothetical protein
MACATLTPPDADSTLWFIGAFGACLLGTGIFLVHRQIEPSVSRSTRRIANSAFGAASLSDAS